MWKTALTLASAVISIGTAAAAETLYVDGSVPGSGDGRSRETAFRRIQEGIDAASEGDTVIVAQGTYLENIQFDGRNIVLRSTDPFDPNVVQKTIIDGNGAGPVVTFAGTEDPTSTLSGFTVRHGSSYSGGGGIAGGKWGGPQTRATVENNQLQYNEGGLAWCGGSVRNNVIRHNDAPIGLCVGGGLYDCDGVIGGNVISENSAMPGDWPWHWGGGGGLADCDGTIRGNVICRNYAEVGGGLYGCDGLIEGNVISDNWAAWDGGGLSSCRGTMCNNLVVANSANPHEISPFGGLGGGLHDCLGLIQNNTVVGNSAAWSGGGSSGSSGTALIVNCILWGNTAPLQAQVDSAGNLVHCHIQDWVCGEIGNVQVPGDPGFLNPESGDYRLRPQSPCIDSGFSGLELPGADIAGMHRVMFGGKSLTVDIGAHEFYINALTPGPEPHQTTFTWSSLADKTYSIFYTDDLFNWHTAIANFPSSGNTTTFWIDDGFQTGLPPGLVPRRFYRTLENPQ